MRDRKTTKNVILVGALTLVMGVTVLFSGVGESYAASELKLNKTSRNILTRRSYDFDVVGASEDAEITWKSSDEAVATVDQDGVVTGITKGEAKITCTIKDGGKTKKLTATAKIRKPSVKIVIKNKIEKLKVGKKYDLNRKLTPSTSNDVTTWTTSDKKIATVDKMGVVTAKKNGTVTITATTLSGKTDSVEITVYGGKATATPKPTSKPKATKAPAKATEAPKATTAPKATKTPAKAETKNFTFAQMIQPTDKGAVWGCKVDVNGGKLTMTSDEGQKYSQSFWQFPVDMKNVEKVTFNGVKGDGVEFRLMTADEYTAYDGSQSSPFQSSETVYETKGAPLAYFVIVSKDGNLITADSVTFAMKASAAEAPKATATPAPQKPVAGNLTYKFTDLKENGNWEVTPKAANGALELSFNQQYNEIHLQFPQPVDLSGYTKAVITFATASDNVEKDAICFKFAEVGAAKNEYGNPVTFKEEENLVTSGKDKVEISLDGFSDKKVDEISVMCRWGKTNATVYDITFTK